MAPRYNSVIKFTFMMIIYSYGFWYGISDLIFSFMPLGLIPALIILISMRLFRVSPPRIEQLEMIVGKDSFGESDDNNVAMRSVAHRGAGLDAPENSLIAFQLCKEKGCNFIEFDVTLTKDGVPVVFHDDNLSRIANINKMVSDCTWDELKLIDISATHPYSEKFRGTRIPTLNETVKQLMENDQNMFIDLKDDDLRMVNIILELFTKYPDLVNRAIVTTFYPVLLYLIRRGNSKIVCSMAFRPYFFSHISYSYAHGVGPRRAKNLFQHALNCIKNSIYTWSLPNLSYYMVGLSMILLHKDYVSPQIIRDWHTKGIRVGVWSINQLVEKQYYSKILKCTYFTDTLTGESSTHLNKK